MFRIWGLNYSPNYLPPVFYIFTSSLSARYTDTQRKYTQYVASQAVDTYQRDGNTNRSIRMNITLMNATLLSSWASKIKSKMPSAEVSPKDKEEGAPKKDMTEEEKMKYEEQMKKEEEQKKKEEMKKEEEQKKKEEMKQEGETSNQR